MRRESGRCQGFVASLLVAGLCLAAAPVGAQHIVEGWGTVPAPPAPELKPVVLEPGTTALLVLDIQRQICNVERRPRCVAMLPGVQRFLAEARGKGLTIIHSLAGEATPSDLLKEVAARSGEPVVRSGPDKFLRTELEPMLRERGIQTVVVVGTAAHGAVLHTAAAAAFRGLKVVVPVDGMAAESLYAEQYTAWHLANAPRVSAQTTLTILGRIRFP